MKKGLKIMVVTLTTLFMILMNHATSFARGTDNASSDSSLSSLQIIGGVVLLLLVILLPLTKVSRKEMPHK